MLRAAAAALAAVAADAAASGNMNGKYRVASGKNQNVDYNDDMSTKGYEYFDVWSPEIATHYGEVFWTSQGNQPLPDEIVKRFKGKVMAIQGYEQDQVMVTPTGKPGVNPEQDVSVPINWAYNHHYMFWMTGQHSVMEEVEMDEETSIMQGYHGLPKQPVARELPSAALRTGINAGTPTSQMFSEGNGGESRKSYHSYPDGYAQLIDSPNQWHITPMQIDTRNRECGVGPESVTNCTAANPVPYAKFTPGIEPRSSRTYVRPIPEDTMYSGLLECPCTSSYGGWYGDRTKIIDHEYAALDSGKCGASEHVTSPDACYAAAPTIGLKATAWKNVTVADVKLPPGCSVVIAKDGSAAATWNTAGKADCGGSGALVGSASSSVTSTTLGLSLDAATTTVTITATGPADAWFGFGFNAGAMSDAPYTLVVNASGVIEQKIGTCGSEAEHCPGTQLSSSVKITSNTVSGSVRTVVMTRPFQGATKDHYTFDPAVDTIRFITAAGSSPVFAYHKAKDIKQISVVAGGGATCICDKGAKGQMCSAGGVGCKTFQGRCRPEPQGDLRAQRNPTCNSRQYVGGLTGCCAHKRILLDADQKTPDALLRYHMKIRYWFKELTTDADGKPSHIDLPRVYIQTEWNAGEYDIPPAFAVPGWHPAGGVPGYPGYPAGVPSPGTTCTGTCPDGPDCECVHTITSHFRMNARLIYAGGHCHAPSCKSLELFNADTGELVCGQYPYYGKGEVHVDKYDEEGYIAIPPCLWSDKEKGLLPTKLINANMMSIAREINTKVGHYGQMASWQMRAAATDPHSIG